MACFMKINPKLCKKQTHVLCSNETKSELWQKVVHLVQKPNTACHPEDLAVKHGGDSIMLKATLGLMVAFLTRFSDAPFLTESLFVPSSHLVSCL